ncbi:MAG: hypothetical protein AB7P03_11230 [Kofleriaceae bacterium]
MISHDLSVRAVVVASVAIATLLASACESSNPHDDVLLDWAALKAKMCGCPDKACADTVMAEWTEYRMSLNTKVGKAKPTADQERRGRELEAALRECRRKIVPAGSGSAPTSGE